MQNPQIVKYQSSAITIMYFQLCTIESLCCTHPFTSGQYPERFDKVEIYSTVLHFKPKYLGDAMLWTTCRKLCHQKGWGIYAYVSVYYSVCQPLLNKKGELANRLDHLSERTHCTKFQLYKFRNWIQESTHLLRFLFTFIKIM